MTLSREGHLEIFALERKRLVRPGELDDLEEFLEDLAIVLVVSLLKMPCGA